MSRKVATCQNCGAECHVTVNEEGKKERRWMAPVGTGKVKSDKAKKDATKADPKPDKPAEKEAPIESVKKEKAAW